MKPISLPESEKSEQRLSICSLNPETTSSPQLTG
jgi:hypothetical protein